jgi:hypothetical protein
VNFTEVTSGQHSATVDIYKKVGTCTLALGGQSQKSSQLFVRENPLGIFGELVDTRTMGSSVIHHPSEFQSVWMISQGPKKLYNYIIHI